MRVLRLACCALMLSLPLLVVAQTRGERLRHLLGQRQADAAETQALPAGTRVLRDIAYGQDPAQRYDVYAPAEAHGLPIIAMVHGGGWSNGDKDNPGLATPKAAYWLPRRYVLVSINYRMLPDADPAQQARDIAAAIAHLQQHAKDWGGDASRTMLMGHSAGAHLVALLGADVEALTKAGASRPRAVVALDSAAMNVEQIMQARHFPLYDRAFGADPSAWVAVSPWHHLSRASLPMLAVCSSRRDDSCAQARGLAQRAQTFGVAIQVLPEDLSHMQINRTLGEASDYTSAVDRFIANAVK
ncbi:Acetyl esterase/lipase [Pseudoxanthomonas sp. GM95]|uniref:alpha/beta hydrolase n=1 Tax=Pseudoxanthomonas sp. GM95 TaxID=1881043 RepID=UPI0008CCDB5F|nr:alpha/beta hydrolase [Pseudoxanthomonas sp. GM95]SEM47586.1 Acetyl esterase/lipase [Pseudoxanthomonas sp. GM95]